MPPDWLTLFAQTGVVGAAVGLAALTATISAVRAKKMTKDAYLASAQARARAAASNLALLKETTSTSSSSRQSTSERLSKVEADLALVEERLPNKAVLDKVASVNDAVLATRLEEVQRRLESMGRSAMTPDDVMKRVFVVVTLLFGLVTVVVAVLTLLTGPSGGVTPGAEEDWGAVSGASDHLKLH